MTYITSYISIRQTLTDTGKKMNIFKIIKKQKHPVMFPTMSHHILHIEDPDPDNPMEQSCCLVHNGKLLSLEYFVHIHKILKGTRVKIFKPKLDTTKGP